MRGWLDPAGQEVLRQPCGHRGVIIEPAWGGSTDAWNEIGCRCCGVDRASRCLLHRVLRVVRRENPDSVPVPNRFPKRTRARAATRDRQDLGALVCQLAFVQRDAQGWWLQLAQRATTGDLSGYLRAVRAPARPPPSCGYHAGQQASSQTAPLLALDSDGVLHRLGVPANCSGSVPAVKAAASRLRWLPARTRWLNQILPAGIVPGDCLGFLCQALGLNWPLETYLISLPAKSRYFNARAYFRDQVCALRDPMPTGPVAADLILARRRTGAVAVGRVLPRWTPAPGSLGPTPSAGSPHQHARCLRRGRAPRPPSIPIGSSPVRGPWATPTSACVSRQSQPPCIPRPPSYSPSLSSCRPAQTSRPPPAMPNVGDVGA